MYLSIDESLEEGQAGVTHLHWLTRLKEISNSKPDRLYRMLCV